MFNQAQTEVKDKTGEIDGLKQGKINAETAEKQLKMQLSQSQIKLDDAERTHKNAEATLKQKIRHLDAQIVQKMRTTAG